MARLLQRPIRLPAPDRRDIPALLGLLGLVLFLFSAAVRGSGFFFERDIGSIRLAQAAAFFESLTRGAWPLWDPFSSFGQPLLANPSAQVLYPPTWLLLVMQPWTQYTVYVVLHVIFAGVGSYFLCRALGLSRAAGFLAAGLWIGSGPLLSLVNMWQHLGGAAWLPWVLLASERALESGRWIHALAWGAALAGQLLAGSPDLSLLTGLAVAANTLRHLWAGAWRGGRSWSVVRVAALALAFGLALSACQWLPAVELSSRSARWDLSREARTTWSLHPVLLLETLVPVRLQGLPLHPRWLMAWLDFRETLLRSVYLGLASLGLVAAALLDRGFRARRLLVALLAAASLIALGRHFVAYDVATWILPPLRLLRHPSKAMVIAAFAWCLLAGAGFDCWRRGEAVGRLRRLGVAGPPLLLGLACAAAAVVTIAAPEAAARLLLAPAADGLPETRLAATGLRLALAGGLGVAVAGLALARGRLRRTWPALVLAGLALADVVAQNRSLNPLAPRELFSYRPELLDAIDAPSAPRLYVYDYSVATRRQQQRGVQPTPRYALRRAPLGWDLAAARVLGVQAYLNPPIGGRWGVSGSYDLDLFDLHPPQRVRLSEFLREVEGRPAHLRLLQLGAVDYLVALHDGGIWTQLTPRAELAGFFRDPIRVYRVPEPLPRAFVVGGARVADDSRALDVLIDPGFDPRSEIVLPDGHEQPRGRPGTCRVLERRPDRWRLEARLDGPGYLVLIEGYDPGWRARVDGQPAELLRANLVFRAVRLDAGSHVIELEYRPTSVLAGFAASSAALLLGALLALRCATRETPA